MTTPPYSTPQNPTPQNPTPPNPTPQYAASPNPTPQYAASPNPTPQYAASPNPTPQYAGQQYAAPQHSGQPAYPSPTESAARVRNPAGMVALVLGAVALLTATASVLAQAIIVASRNYPVLDVVLPAFAGVQIVVALAAVVFGAVGLSRKGRPKGVAGVGLGIGAAVVWLQLGGFVYGAIVQLLV